MLTKFDFNIDTNSKECWKNLFDFVICLTPNVSQYNHCRMITQNDRLRMIRAAC